MFKGLAASETNNQMEIVLMLVRHKKKTEYLVVLVLWM